MSPQFQRYKRTYLNLAATPRRGTPPDLALADQTSLAASHGTALVHGKWAVAEPARLRTATEISSPASVRIVTVHR
jgi:hypothetical protein